MPPFEIALLLVTNVICFLTVLKTDTSSWVEDTKALEITTLKELGKLTL